MQIGEFAEKCNTRISVLRHYDKEGLLKPEYVDPFTSYRYYSPEQIPVFYRITALKEAGFTLGEIRKMLAYLQSNESVLTLFEQKKEELTQMLSGLEALQKKVIGSHTLLDITFSEQDDVVYARSSALPARELAAAKKSMDEVLDSKRYQRVTVYSAEPCPDGAGVTLFCQVVKLQNSLRVVRENIEMTFENDENVVGKWVILGEYAVKSDFYEDVYRQNKGTFGNTIKEIYFLPNGEPYWGFGWTRGKLLCKMFQGSTVNPYVIEEHEGCTYMFVEFKSFAYMRGGRPTVLVLRQINQVSYTMEQIAQRDDMNLPFCRDDKVLGKWRAVDVCASIEGYARSGNSTERLIYQNLEFCPEGEMIGSGVCDGEPWYIHDSARLCWTRGYVLNMLSRTADEYQLRCIDGVEYLFLEWKSGDYIFGGMEPLYFVFVRE